jgi:hypothetical protein
MSPGCKIWAMQRRAALSLLPLLAASAVVRADPPIWANARHVKATVTQCGTQRYLLLKSDAIKLKPQPASPGCTVTETFFGQGTGPMPYFGTGKDATISASNVTGGTIFCGKEGGSLVTLGPPAAVAVAMRRAPAPRGCTYSTPTYQVITSMGNIPFTDVENGGTMTVAESLAMHQKERDRIIADCNANAACRAEVARRSAINAYYECLKPTQYEHVCTKPW